VRYLTWKLTWPNDRRYGYGPEPVAAEHGGKAEASQWVNSSGVHLGYLYGDVGLVTMGSWGVKELTANQALMFAKSIDPNAYIGAGGRIATTTPSPGGDR
jgi:hypothetical protein